jgi:site-specific DNA-adenine methylase
LCRLENIQYSEIMFAYPGKKEHLIGKIDLKCDTLIEPYLGSGVISLATNPETRLIIAEADINIRCLINLIKLGMSGGIIEKTIEIKERFLEEKYKTWEYVIEILHNDKSASVNKAACKLLFQRIAHGSIPRDQNNGRLNVIWSPDKVRTLENWMPELESQWSRRDFVLYDSCAKCWEMSDRTGKVIAFIDPPYYSLGMTRCYPGHRPKDFKTLLAGFKTVERAMQTCCDVIYYTHYDLAKNTDHVLTLASTYGYTVDITPIGQLKTLGRGIGNYKNGSRTVEKSPLEVDTLYTFLKKR